MRLRAAILLLLLASGSFLALAPPAPAQAAPTLICFNRDPHVAGACVTERPPNYLQGSDVGVNLTSFAGTETFLSARCVRGCPAGDPSASNVYWAIYRGHQLIFPRDFTDPGPDDDGANAILDKAPRYNSTWEVRAHLTTPIVREFNVWLYDAESDANFTVRPGAQHYLRATGFDPGAQISYVWERRDPTSGRFVPFHAPFSRAISTGPAAGWFEEVFQFPKSAAANVSACGRSLHDCYRIVISGPGKQLETVYVQVGLAHITRSEQTTPRPSPTNVPTLQRTMNASFDIDLYYPGGRLDYGPKMLPEDAPESVVHGGRALRVAVEKYYPGNETSYLLGEVPLRFDDARFVWNARWTIPKDLPLEPTARYRLRLLEQPDRYGNIVDQDVLGNFTVEAAELTPRVLEPFRELERTAEGILRVQVLYHNGTPFTRDDAPTDNESPLSGCFVRVPPPPPEPAPPTQAQVQSCVGRDRAWGRYYDGAWNFTVKYPRDYEFLDEHRFFLENGTKDRWGNEIWRTATGAFTVIPASPRVELSTVMRGRDADVLERGSRVYVTATITYPDGSPYSHRVRENPNSTNATRLEGTLIRRGPAPNGTYGPLAGEEPFNLTETDPSAGRWAGTLQLTDDDTFTPVGIWTFKFVVEDNVTVPNRNETAFDREVVSALIEVCPTFQPASRAATGTTIKFRFRLFYSECETGREVPAGALESRLTARVYRHNPHTGLPFGAPVSNAIVPSYARDGSQSWTIEYEIPKELFIGSYVFVLSGADAYGNKLVTGARSRAFSTFTDVLTRQALTNPPAEVRRGDSATVVFDAREGDTGVDPRIGAPRIQLERFDTSTTDCPKGVEEGGCWVRERGDVRVNDPTLADHMGVFPVGVDTPVGLYRFALQGRDADFRIITGLSANFTVNPTQVTRALLAPPPEQAVKGTPFSFKLESLPGDQVRERISFLNGRPITLPAPVMAHELGALNITWSIPFDAPTGNYSLRLSGRDVNGNIITIITPPIEALAASLEGRIIGQPTRAVERGDEARLLFGVAYPDGGFYAATDAPRVFVHNAAGPVEQAQVRREGLTFAAFWEPGPDAPLGEYYFEVSPQPTGGTGNLFPPLRSAPFRLVPGTVLRNPVDEMPAEVERLTTAAYTVPFEADDKFAGFELVYYGPSLSTAISVDTPLVEITRSPLPHTIDANGGKYVARLVTDHASQVGTFRIIMTGEDANGNRIVSESRPFVVRPTTVGIAMDRALDQNEFGEGKTITLSFTAKYRVGTVMDETYGRPSVVVLYNNRPVTQRPEVEFRDGHWYATWTAPEILPPGEYQFAIGGADVQGNPVATSRSNPVIMQEGSVPESFMKVIPGPSPALLLVALAAIAGLLLRRRKAD